MSQDTPLHAEKTHLAGLLEAIQRCVYFLNASSQTLQWPLEGGYLTQNKKDIQIFEALAAISERFAQQVLNVSPLSSDFSQEFNEITQANT